MIYFVSQDWKTTHGNHAGMVHLCNQIAKNHTEEVAHIIIPDFCFFGSRLIYHLIHVFLGLYLAIKMNREDKLVLMEYLVPLKRQDYIASFVKRVKKCSVYALVHLTPEDLDYYFPQNESLQEWCDRIDVLMTLGSSLTSYIKKRNINVDIRTVFHYVDLEYYKPSEPLRFDKKRVIIMGNMKRNFDSLERIVSNCPDIDFVYLKGKSMRNTGLLNKYPNIRILGYIEEKQLKEEMEACNISLNMMYDTIGSNVITTSLSMGLAMFVSDVGSIRDYCDETCAVFCSQADDFIRELNSISLDTVKVLSQNSDLKSYMLSAERFYDAIISFKK